MKFLFAFTLCSVCIFATTTMVNAYNIGVNNIGLAGIYNAQANAPVNGAPVGTLLSQRILPSAVGYGVPAVGYGVPAVGYGVPAVGYGAPVVGIGAPAVGYGNSNSQVQSLVKLALSLPTPAPDASIQGKGYLSPYKTTGIGNY